MDTKARFRGRRPAESGRLARAVTRRGVLAGALAGGAGLALPACGGGASTAGQTTSSVVARPTKIEAVIEWGSASQNREAFDGIVARARQVMPNLTVEISQAPGSGVRSYEMVLTRLAAGNPPDVSETYIANSGNLSARRIAEPLQTLWKGQKDWSADDYFDGAREAWTYKGDFVASPFVTAPMAVCVNQELFGRAGLKVPPPAWTWEDFTSSALKLTQGQGEGKVYGANMPTGNGFGTMNFFGGPMWSYGGDWADRKTARLTFNEPPAVAALEMWVDVALKQQAAPTAPVAAWQGLKGGPFANGLAAMQFIGAPELGQAQKDATGFEWTTVQMPRKTKQGSHFYSTSMYVLRQSKEKQAASEFLRFVMSPDNLAYWNGITLGMVTRKSAAQKREWQDLLKQQPRMVAFDAATGYMRAYPVIPGWDQAANGNEGIGQALLDAVQGKAAPKAALDEGLRRAEAFLATQGNG
jgi:ABC-type glycerol-3-phosphate transport system substrate-binding protein